MTGSPAVSIVLVFDENHARHAAVVLQSASATLASGFLIDAHLIVAGISAKSRRGLRRVEESLANLDIQIHQASTDQYDDWLHGGHISAAAYLRLELADHLGESVERAIYLDTDVVCVDSLHLLNTLDLHGYAVGAIRDTSTPFVSSKRGIVRHLELGLDPVTPYFNSGVMVVDVAQWRTADPVGFGRSYVADHGDVQQALDQEVLNVCFTGNWQQLPLRWNVSPRLASIGSWGDEAREAIFRTEASGALADPGIVHYLGPRKPWQFRSQVWRRDLYLRHAANSQFLNSRFDRAQALAEEILAWTHRIEVDQRRRLRRLRR